ncbi:MAG: alpha/beta hydrolase [Candidatus Limnocylindrales bacterium]
MTNEHRWLPVPGGTLHIKVEGDGPPILLIHAGIADLRAWDALVPLLVDAGYQAVRYDTRGYGQSRAEDLEYSNRADLRAVLDELAIGRAAFVGNSRGAMIALDTLLESPDRCVAFAWVGGGIGGFDGRTTDEEKAVFEAADALEESGEDPGALADLEVRIWVDGIGQPAGRAPAWIRDKVREMDLPLLQPDRVTGRPVPLDPPSANERLGDIRVPVLAVVGALDVTDTRDASERLAAAVPGARHVVIPDVAHMVGMEAPERLAELILELVRPLGTWG